MSVRYDYGFDFQLRDDCPAEIINFVQRLAAGETVSTLPHPNSAADDHPPLLALLSPAPAGQVIGFSFCQQRLALRGSAAADVFYMPFMALVEWLAPLSATVGCVGYYHVGSLLHPTLVYFHQGKPYLLQVTGTPLGFAHGEAMPSTTIGKDDEDRNEKEEGDAESDVD